MSFDAQRWAYDLDGLSAAGKSVLTALAFMANADGECWPSQAHLARMTALGERTVRRELRGLEEEGLLTRARRTNARGRSTDVYRLAVPATLAGTPSSTGHTGRSVPATVAREQSVEQSDLEYSSPAPPASRTIDEVQAPTELDPSKPARSAAPAKVGGSAQPATRSDVEGLLDHLDQRIAANGARLPSRTKTNRDSARLMLDVDGRNLEEAHQLIDWATRDEFWRTNILSMSKFRAKYDQLRMKANLHHRPAAVRDEPLPMPDVDPDDVVAWVAAMEARTR